MAEYRDRYAEIRAAGASVAVVSVDRAERSEALRAQLTLPFPILCDSDRRVVREWGIYNSRERGGIAKPAVFILDRGRVVRFAEVDGVAKRLPPGEIVSLLKDAAPAQTARRKVYLPMLSDWIRAIRNAKR